MPDFSSPLPLAGKAALITGGARRIGRAIALDLARAGAAVAFTYRKSAADAFETERQLRGIGASSLGIQLDLRHSHAIHDALATAHAALGGWTLS